MTDSLEDTAYQVLARKYRPRAFDDLLGHEAMVRTLRNAFASNRIAHAWMLTGVRGVGKTTTARILARALNYEVAGKIDAPTIDMEEDGVHCLSIAESRHPDVVEMDAASRTGVGDIRELIESVRYAPVQARYKVYIIDEVHMLTNNAFNALLKTLEEPPPHVKFIFATTEIRKVPVTVLSRCQRFDLRRFDQETLADFLEGIAAKENAKVERDGMVMIARAAEGSVRDALSLLDQAVIQHIASGGGDAVSAAQVQDMLGLADRTISWDLLEAALRGKAAESLQLFRTQYDAGADPTVILRDLLELVHLLTRVKAAGEEAAAQGAAGSADAGRAKQMAEIYAMNGLTRAWGLLMKSLEETRSAPDAAAAAEMGLIRLCYAADLPTPDEALRMLMNGTPAPAAKGGQAEQAGQGGTGHATGQMSGPTSHQGGNGHTAGNVEGEPQSGGNGAAMARAQSGGAMPAGHRAAHYQPHQKLEAANEARLGSLADIIELTREKRDAKLREEIEKYVRLVKMAPGLIEFNPAPGAPRDLAGRLAGRLKEWTGERWAVSVNAREAGAETLRTGRNDIVRAHPLVQAALATFPALNAERDLRIKEILPVALDDGEDSEAEDDDDDNPI